MKQDIELNAEDAIEKSDEIESSKVTKFNKIINFLDDKKWLFFIIALIVLFVSYAIDSFLKKEQNDIQILYTGYEFIDDSQIEDIKNTCNYLSSDYNGDDILKVDFLSLIVDKKVDYEGKYTYDPNMVTRFNTELNTLSSIIYIVEPSYYELLRSSDLLLPLRDIINETPEGAIDEFSILLGTLDISTQDGFKELSPDSLICIRRNSKDKEIRYISDEQYNYNLDFFKKIISFTLD